MHLVELLEQHSTEIIDEATGVLVGDKLTHYQDAGVKASKLWLSSLLELTGMCVKTRNLVPMIDYMNRTAGERFEAGFDIMEVQTAINVLEEAIWKRVLKEVPTSEFAEALGLVSTVLGAAKDRLASTYVSLASKAHSPTLNLTALFEGGEESDERLAEMGYDPAEERERMKKKIRTEAVQQMIPIDLGVERISQKGFAEFQPLELFK